MIVFGGRILYDGRKAQPQGKPGRADSERNQGAENEIPKIFCDSDPDYIIYYST